jgi:SAM-dependent methyltransferase
MTPARMRELFALWKNEKTDPAPFYTELAKDTVADLDRRHGPLRGQRILDLGCGPGFYTAAFRAYGADCVPVDAALDELTLAGDPPEGYVLADAGDLPFADASVDGAFCSNLLEHTANTPDVIAEIERVLRPGGWGYISWTNWYSPWGGHDMTPYHLLGPERGPRLSSSAERPARRRSRRRRPRRPSARRARARTGRASRRPRTAPRLPAALARGWSAGARPRTPGGGSCR